MPRAMASAVLWIVTSAPSKVIRPESAVVAPDRILMRVDLPAPFSPTRACTVPARTVMSALRMARTAPYRLDTPVTANRSVPVVGVWLIVSSLRSVPLDPAEPGRAGRPALPTPRSVVVVPGVVLGDGQRRAEQQDLGAAVVGHR